MSFKVSLFAFLFALLFASFSPFFCQKCENETKRRTSRSAKRRTLKPPLLYFLRRKSVGECSFSSAHFGRHRQGICRLKLQASRAGNQCARVSQNVRAALVLLSVHAMISSCLKMRCYSCFRDGGAVTAPVSGTGFCECLLRDFLGEIQPMGQTNGIH